MNIIDKLFGREPKHYDLNLLAAILDLDDSIEILRRSIEEIREEVDYLAEFLGIDD